MSARPLLLVRLEPQHAHALLDGREYDARVTYCTYVNISKKYPYASKRQNREDVNENEQG